ncbi:hypothetical protein Bca52824_036363 [Brassica carinata]|uniref:TF-B3 domain-containing protein n=1 Tax=Brassica carinata TaxID=52824 RepID=A0A8X7S5D4_BRACI|nr:hypothetical protein Bca52824_036363 [Brassica carinata]
MDGDLVSSGVSAKSTPISRLIHLSVRRIESRPDIVIFKLEGEMVFHVSPFGPSCCDIQYTAPQSEEEAVAKNSSQSFRAEVTETNVQEDKLALPVEATGCKALNKQCKEATLVNIDGKPWTVALRFSESGGFYYIKGWRKLRHDNKCRSGLVCYQRGWRWDVITIDVCVCSSEGDLEDTEHLEEKVKRW